MQYIYSIYSKTRALNTEFIQYLYSIYTVIKHSRAFSHTERETRTRAHTHFRTTSTVFESKLAVRPARLSRRWTALCLCPCPCPSRTVPGPDDAECWHRIIHVICILLLYRTTLRSLKQNKTMLNLLWFLYVFWTWKWILSY